MKVKTERTSAIEMTKSTAGQKDCSGVSWKAITLGTWWGVRVGVRVRVRVRGRVSVGGRVRVRVRVRVRPGLG